MKPLVLGWLKSKGVTLSNEASDQSVLEAIQKSFTESAQPFQRIAALGNSATLENTNTSLTSKVTALENEKTTLTTKITTLENAAKTEREARAAAVVDLACARGKCNVHERAAKITALGNSAQFDKDAQTLLGGAFKIKTIAGADTQRAADGKALANTGADGDLQGTYKTAFDAEIKAGVDPVRAHSNVMCKNPFLKDAFANAQMGGTGARTN